MGSQFLLLTHEGHRAVSLVPSADSLPSRRFRPIIGRLSLAEIAPATGSPIDGPRKPFVDRIGHKRALVGLKWGSVGSEGLTVEPLYQVLQALSFPLSWPLAHLCWFVPARFPLRCLTAVV
jgi:hypothetical protein